MGAKVKGPKIDENRSKRTPRPKPAAYLPEGIGVAMSAQQVQTALGGISERMLRKLVEMKGYPPRDFNIGDSPRWLATTHNAWLAKQSSDSGEGQGG